MPLRISRNRVQLDSVPMNLAAEVDVASAVTTNIGAALSNNIRITGTTTITSLGTADAGITRTLRFAGILTLTYNATSLILPGGGNITTAANDTAEFLSLGSGNWMCRGYNGTDFIPYGALSRLFNFRAAMEVTLTGVAGAGTGYQVAISVSYSGALPNSVSFTATRALGTNDSGSLRFYSSSGALLPMFVESIDGDGNAVVWVKVSDDLGSDVKIYAVDTGDAAAANVSDGDAVFELFDHFNSGTLDGTKWSGSGVTFAGSGQSAYALLTGANATISLKSVQTFGDGYEVCVNGRFPNASASGNGMIVGFDAQYYYYNKSADTANSYIGKGAYGSADVSQGSRINSSANYTVRVGRSAGNGRVMGANSVGIPVTTTTTLVPTTAASVYLNNVYATGQTGRVNYAFVKKYVGATEPGISSVISLGGVHDHSNAAQGGDTLSPASVSCSGTVTGTAPADVVFALVAQGPDNYDCHGVLINTLATTPTSLNKIGNLRFSLNGAVRWTVKKDDTVESGTTTGSDLTFQAHNTSGTAVGNNLRLRRNLTSAFGGLVEFVSSAPASASATGTAGQFTWDANYLYICTATNTWKRVAVATW